MKTYYLDQICQYLASEDLDEVTQDTASISFIMMENPSTCFSVVCRYSNLFKQYTR